MPDFSAIVDNATLKANAYNLNIRRYADNAPPHEPHDVRAHVLGGVPKAEIAVKTPLFAAHGFDPLDLFVERDALYMDFRAGIASQQALKPLIERNPGITAQEAALRAQFASWWQEHRGHITALVGSQSLVGLRQELLDSFIQSLETLGVLDVFHVHGIIAGFWNQTQYEFLAFGFYRHRRFINDFCQHFSDQLRQGFRIRQPPKPLRQCPPVQRFTNWPIRSNASPASGRVGPNKCQTCSNSGQVSSSAGEPAALALFT